jgi:hypothetical protein
LKALPFPLTFVPIQNSPFSDSHPPDSSSGPCQLHPYSSDPVNYIRQKTQELLYQFFHKPTPIDPLQFWRGFFLRDGEIKKQGTRYKGDHMENDTMADTAAGDPSLVHPPVETHCQFHQTDTGPVIVPDTVSKNGAGYLVLPLINKGCVCPFNSKAFFLLVV